MAESQRASLEELKGLASRLQPEWRSVATVQSVSREQEGNSREPKTLAQCCKPGPCSPKR